MNLPVVRVPVVRVVVSADQVWALVRTPLARRDVRHVAALTGHPGDDVWIAALDALLRKLPRWRLVLALCPDLAVPREVAAPRTRRRLVEAVLQRHAETIDPGTASVVLAVLGDVHRDRVVVVTVDEPLLARIFDVARTSARSVAVVSAVEAFARQGEKPSRVIDLANAGHGVTFGVHRRAVVGCRRGGDDEERIGYVRQRVAETLIPRRPWRWPVHRSSKPAAAGEPEFAVVTAEALAWAAARGSHRAGGRLVAPAEFRRRRSVEKRRFRQTAAVAALALAITGIVDIADTAVSARRVRAERAALMPAATAFHAELRSAVRVREGLVEWGVLVDASPRWAPLLGELANALPEQAVLTRLSSHGDTLTLEGWAPDAGTVLAMFRRVHALADVELTAPPARDSEKPTSGEAFAMRARILPRSSIR